MEDLLLVDVSCASSDLTEVEFDLRLCEDKASSGDIEQCLLRSQLQDHVDKLTVLEVMIEFDNVDVRHLLMNSDLPFHLLLDSLPFLGDVEILVNYFDSEMTSSTAVCDLVNLSESSFSDEISSVEQNGRTCTAVNQHLRGVNEIISSS